MFAQPSDVASVATDTPLTDGGVHPCKLIKLHIIAYIREHFVQFQTSPKVAMGQCSSVGQALCSKAAIM